MINELKEQVNNNNTNSNIFLKSYPVGSIYISTSSTNPGSTYGGTWVEYGKGKTLVGVDSSDTDFNTAEKIGGEKTHTLTIDEMPSHKHRVMMYLDQTGSVTIPAYRSYYKWSSNTMSYTSVGVENGKFWETGLTLDVGGSQPHNNLQPYITVYMWKRTA